MRTWKGTHDGSVNVGDDLTTIRNVSFRKDGVLIRRPQLRDRFAMDSVVIQGLTHPIGGSFLVSADGLGNLAGVDLPTGTKTTLSTGLDASIAGTLTTHQAKLYYNNDFNSPVRMERGDLAAVTAGIAAPASAPVASSVSSGALIAGVYRMRYRYYDDKTGYLSNPSAELTQTVTASQSIRVAGVGTSDTKVTKVFWERTAAAGAVFYREGTATTATALFVFTVSDTVLAQGIAIDAIYGDYGHEPPPFVEIMCEHRGRMFGWKRSVRTKTSCSVASGVGTINGTGFPTTGAWDGRLLTVNSEKTTNIIASTTSTVITLASAYAGTASGAANTIRVFHPQPDMLLWSRAGFPESWKLSTWARRVLQGGADEPSALFSAYDTLWLCGQHSIRCFDYTADPAAARLSSIPTDMGVFNQECIVQADGRTFGLGQSGAFELQGRVPTRISDGIIDQLQDLMDTAQFDDFHGCYDPYELTVTWYFTRIGDTVPKDGICYSVESGQWQFVSYLQPIKCSTTYGSATYPYRPYLADTNGYVWRVGDDRVADCLPSTMTTGVLTTSSANSTTIINIVESLPTGTGDCKGAMLYWPATGESRVITANTANTVTVGSAFTTAPGTGITLYLGSISVYLKSDQWMMRSPQHLKRPPYLGIQHLSDTTAPVAYVSLYANASATPTQWTTSSGDIQLTGVTVTSATVRTVDMNQGSGVLYVPMPDSWVNYWQWTFTQDRPEGTLKLMDVQFMLTESSQVDTNIKPT